MVGDPPPVGDNTTTLCANPSSGCSLATERFSPIQLGPELRTWTRSVASSALVAVDAGQSAALTEETPRLTLRFRIAGRVVVRAPIPWGSAPAKLTGVKFTAITDVTIVPTDPTRVLPNTWFVPRSLGQTTRLQPSLYFRTILDIGRYLVPSLHHCLA